MLPRLASPALALTSLLVLGACTDDSSADTDTDTLACVEIDYEGCTQLYPPTYDQVWDQTLAPSCGVGGSCHPSGGPAGSLTFDDAETTLSELLDGGHVIPGDPHCSPLMIRLESDDPSVRMPPGETPILASARCSVATWIAEGAAP